MQIMAMVPVKITRFHRTGRRPILRASLQMPHWKNAIASSCYWSLCGETCNSTYFDVTEARGQVANVPQNLVCPQYRILCCAPQTVMGTCQWEGYRGAGLLCIPASEDPDAVAVAQNMTFGVDEDGLTSDLTYIGGYQAYCGSGFVPSSRTNTAKVFLYKTRNFKKAQSL